MSHKQNISHDKTLLWSNTSDGAVLRPIEDDIKKVISMFVFPRDNPQQNVLSLLTPGSDSVTIALSDGMIHFALHRVAYSTRIWLVETIPTSRLRALWGWPNVATERKRKGSIKKSNKNWDRNWWQRWHTIFFRATHQENKQCCVKHC